MTGTGPHLCPACGSNDIRFWGHNDTHAWHICNRCRHCWDVPDSRAHQATKRRWTHEQKDARESTRMTEQELADWEAFALDAEYYVEFIPAVSES